MTGFTVLDVEAFYELLARSRPELRMVWCHTCRRPRTVDAAICLRTGWPKCCAQTMTVDKPAGAVDVQVTAFVPLTTKGAQRA